MSSKKTTTVTAIPAVTDEQYNALRAAVSDAVQARQNAEDRVQDARDGVVSESDLEPYVRQFVHAGALTLAVKDAERRVNAAHTAHATAQRELTEAQRKMHADATRHAELAAKLLASMLPSDYLGSISVQPISASRPDHANRRIGEVLVTVTDSPLSTQLVYAALQAVAVRPVGRALDGSPIPGMGLRQDEPYVYVWELPTLDPEANKPSEAQRAMEAITRSAESLDRAQYFADRGRLDEYAAATEAAERAAERRRRESGR